MMNNQISYTDKMLATIFRMKESTVQLALQTFEQFVMVEIIDGVITIPNWGKHQNLDQLEKKKVSQREYMRQYREKQKLLSCNTYSKSNSNANVSRPEEDIEEEREEEKERDKIDYKGIVAAFNSICVSFPSVKALSDARKKAIKARLNTYSIDDFKKLFEKAEASSFLKGKNNSNWSATFDWLLKDSNMAKVLDGNYDDKPVTYRQASKTTKAEELNDFYNMAAEWAKGE